jgi:hypothetical protein
MPRLFGHEGEDISRVSAQIWSASEWSLSLQRVPASSSLNKMPVAIAIFDSEMRYRGVSRRHLSDFEVESRSSVSVKTVGELLSPTAWPENLVITTPQERFLEKLGKCEQSHHGDAYFTKAIGDTRPTGKVVASRPAHPAGLPVPSY